MKQITKEWLEAASLDIESSGYLLQDERLTGHVAFHAQQAIEKSLKALIEESGDRIPKIHSLSKLFDSCSKYIDFQFDDDLIIALDSLYLESRYPGDFGLLPEGKPTLKQAQIFHDFANNIYMTVMHHLQSKK
jgi:HEPN domain-containing protein